MNAPGTPVDEGLQVERTHLAWSRTTLCLATTLAALAKLVLPVTPFLLALAVVGVLLAATALRARDRSQRAARSFGSAPLTSDGRLPALLAGCLALTTLCVAVLLVQGSPVP